MPRKLSDNDDKPRSRGARTASAVAEAPSEHGFLLRTFLYSPKDIIAGAFALAVVIAILTNALFMQAGRHPAPIFGTTTVTTLPAVASEPITQLPRPRPTVANTVIPEAKPPTEAKADAKADPKFDPLTNLVKTTSSVQATNTNIPRPPMSVPISNRVDSTPVSGTHHVAAVQRALNEYGYGQLKPTGTLGPDTQAAIQKFERARKLPVTGQVSDRLVRELASMIGHPVE